MCRIGSKISTVRGNWNELKPRLRTIGEIFYVHNDDINTCVRNQQDYTLGLSSGWRKRLRVRMCEGGKKRRKERLYGFHVSVAVIFSVMR